MRSICELQELLKQELQTPVNTKKIIKIKKTLDYYLICYEVWYCPATALANDLLNLLLLFVDYMQAKQ